MKWFVGCYFKVNDAIAIHFVNAEYKKDVHESFIIDGPEFVHDESAVKQLSKLAKNEMETKYGKIDDEDFTLMSFTRMQPEEPSRVLLDMR